MFFKFNNFFNFLLVYEDIEPRYGRTRTRSFIPTVTVVSSTTRMLFINVYKIYKIYNIYMVNVSSRIICTSRKEIMFCFLF